MAEEKKFEVQIGMHIQETTSGEEQPFFDCPLEYHNVPYDGVVALQKMMVGLLDDLTELGDAKLAEMGKASKIVDKAVDKIAKRRGKK